VPALVEELVDDPRFVHGRAGTILTLGPDTEPFKTPRSTELVRALLTELLPLGNPIQLSRKEVLPIGIRESLRDAPDPAQIVVFTSFTTFARATELEPGVCGIIAGRNAEPTEVEARNAGVAVDACGRSVAMTEHAVVIAGGGPTRMMLGAELAPESVMPQAQPATAVQRGTATPKVSR
jgi:hypothetical protein